MTTQDINTRQHALNFVRVQYLGQRKCQQQRRLLRRQVVHHDLARLLPIIATHDAAFADPGAPHDHRAALADDAFELRGERVGCARTDGQEHDALGAETDHRIRHATLVPAYAATIHKSQGFDYPAVVTPS